MATHSDTQRVFVTGGTGFVGRYVVRELVRRGYQPVCLARDTDSLRKRFSDLGKDAFVGIRGDLHDTSWHGRLAELQCHAAIHLVGIIFESPLKGQTFRRIHVEGTTNVVQAVRHAEIGRYVHMSALGARLDGPSAYSRTKAEAEAIVRTRAPRWTIFRPSIIHGPDGEFMEMMKFFSTSKLLQPFMPYFGDGEHRLQPISVKDVAHCFVAAISNDATVGKTHDLGGPTAYTWKALYDLCALAIRGKKRLKLPVPVPIAKVLARTIMALRVPPMTWLVPYPFNAGQVAMSQEDSVCDPAVIERTFDIKLRGFREELSQYANQID